MGEIGFWETYKMKKNMTSLWKWSLSDSNFSDEIQMSLLIRSEADVLPPSSSEEEKIEKTRNYQKEYHRKYYKEKQQKPYMCRICGKTLSSTALISKDTKSLKDVQKQQTMFRQN